MTQTRLGLLTLAAALCLSTAAAARPADCLLEVAGTIYVNGPCDFEPFGGDGSFIVRGPGVVYFAYVSVIAPGVAEGSWNADPQSTHAHAPLGRLYRNEACWSNDYATVCAW